ncbi:polysaccharide biosynthesis protein [Altererythrobacter sp. SALINAS58]|uniref:polysaccharide biosynthesis protein n=1 Tax=Alteripontixanthobacter muriae TaxID=2705546 RepID=UPI001575CD09|nr:nucleoside-diphosphate sugar epimerase/dehydratase [Alteripontixanthobacter muriae]NTZ43432.1 polysaccharide biosynthesis protein [Alteripontixanthobacter muriae]
MSELRRQNGTRTEAIIGLLVDAAIAIAAPATSWRRDQKRAAVIFGDLFLGITAVWLAFSLRLEQFAELYEATLIFAGALLLSWFVTAIVRRTYYTIFRYAGRGAIVSLTGTMLWASIIPIMFFGVVSYPGVPRTVSILAPFFFLVLISLARIVGRYVLVDLLNGRDSSEKTRRIIIYGAGGAGQRLAQSITAETGMRLVGFIDDDATKQSHLLDGMKVRHSSEIGNLIRSTGATDVVLAVNTKNFRKRRQIVEQVSKFEVQVSSLPATREVIEGRITVDALRPLQVEDLLGRPPVEPRKNLLDRAIFEKVVMVTGAGGSIGNELSRQICTLRPKELLLVEANEFSLFNIGRELTELIAGLPADAQPILRSKLCNVADAISVERLFQDHKPETIFHTAAYKHVSLVQDNILTSAQNNIDSTRHLVAAACEARTDRFILVSSDKAVRPPNVMGATKRICEILLQSRARSSPNTIFAMVRFGNVLGSSGSVVPIFREQIAKGGPLTITHRDVTRYFMTIPEAAQLVIQAGGMAEGGEVFVLDMGKPVRIWDLAKTMIRLSGGSVRDTTNPHGDIELVETGLRPGEKLYEELLIGNEPIKTSHPSIMRAQEACPTDREIEEFLADLDNSLTRNDSARCLRVIARFVPTVRIEDCHEKSRMLTG